MRTKTQLPTLAYKTPGNPMQMHRAQSVPEIVSLPTHEHQNMDATITVANLLLAKSAIIALATVLLDHSSYTLPLPVCLPQWLSPFAS